MAPEWMRRRPSFSISIRAWILIALAAILAAPTLSAAVTLALQFGVLTRPTKDVNQAVVGARSWSDLAWQRRMAEIATRDGVEVGIEARDGRPIYHTPGWSPSPELAQLITNDGGEQGLVQVELHNSATPRERLLVAAAVLGSGLVALLAVLAGILVATSRHVLVPLRRLAEAAGGIEAGDLEVSVPAAGVREIDDLSAAFRSMGRALEEANRRGADLE